MNDRPPVTEVLQRDDGAHAGGDLPRAFVIDDEPGICLFISVNLEKLGFVVETFSNAPEALAAVDRAAPQIIFLDIALSQSDAVDVVKGLGQRSYRGTVQLMSGNPRLLEAIQRVGTREGLTVPPPLNKPFKGADIREAVAAAGFAVSAPADAKPPSSPP